MIITEISYKLTHAQLKVPAKIFVSSEVNIRGTGVAVELAVTSDAVLIGFAVKLAVAIDIAVVGILGAIDIVYYSGIYFVCTINSG